MAAGDKHSGDVEIFEARDGSLKARIGKQHGRNGSLSFSPDGRWLAIGNFDQTILLWDVAEKRQARRLHGHRSAPLSLAFSPDSQLLASGGHDGTVRLWDVAALPEPPAITNVTGVFAFSRDGQRLLTQSGESDPYVVTLWELPARKPLRSWPANRFSDAVFTAEGEIVTATCYGTQAPPELRTYPAAWENVASPQALATSCTQLLLEGVAAGCTSLGLSPDGRLCVTGHDDGSVAFWDTHTGRLQTLHRHRHAYQTLANVVYPVTRVAFSANGRTVATATEARATLITWSVAEQKEIARRVFSDAYDLVTAVSPNGRLVTVGGVAQGHTINFWDADLRESPQPLEGHQDFLLALAFSPDGRTLASGGRDGLLKLWHLPTGRELLTLFSIPHADKFGHVAFSPDGTWLGVADKKGRLRLWHGPAEAGTTVALNELPRRSSQSDPR